MNDHPYVRVSDTMTQEVRMISALATVKEATEMMAESQVSSLVVERRDKADEFGILEIADIAAQVIAQNRALERVNVYEIMSKPVVTLPPDMNIKYAARLLVKFGLSRALVVDSERHPVGIVTLRDLVLRHAGDLS